MWTWIKSNAASLEALGALLTGIVALVALIGVKYQVDANARLQQVQNAREIYREFLAISIQKPELASANYCELQGVSQQTAYEHYVEYMLYTAEQMIKMDPEWREPMFETLKRHDSYICARKDWTTYSLPVVGLVNDLRDSGACKRAKCE